MSCFRYFYKLSGTSFLLEQQCHGLSTNLKKKSDVCRPVRTILVASKIICISMYFLQLFSCQRIIFFYNFIFNCAPMAFVIGMDNFSHQESTFCLC